MYSIQFEFGLLSEASIGNVGIRPNTTGWVDHVVTPAGALGFMLAEDAVDRVGILRHSRGGEVDGVCSARHAWHSASVMHTTFIHACPISSTVLLPIAHSISRGRRSTRSFVLQPINGHNRLWAELDIRDGRLNGSPPPRPLAQTVTYLFNRLNHNLLERFAWSNVLLAFDYDGTLAPLVDSPAHATLRSSTRRLLRRASKLYPCVVITGRAQADALGRLHNIEVCQVVGNHGAEPSPDGYAIRRRVHQWLPLLKARLAGRQGVVIEDKELSVAVHYRQARKRSSTRRAVLSAARSLENVRIVGGKLAVNLLVADAPHKGLALERERAHFACDTVIYLGDDDTDEDVFRMDRPGQLLSIRVGWKRTSAAPYYIRNQAEIDRLLETLVELRGGERNCRVG